MYIFYNIYLHIMYNLLRITRILLHSRLIFYKVSFYCNLNDGLIIDNQEIWNSSKESKHVTYGGREGKSRTSEIKRDNSAERVLYRADILQFIFIGLHRDI